MAFLSLLVLLALSAGHDIREVHVIESCHLDVGFADTAANIVNRYFDRFFLEAAAVGQDFVDDPGLFGENLQFQTHPYLVSLFLDCPPGMGIHCPNASAVATVREAFKKGYLTMQAMPFVPETALFNSFLLQEAVGLSASLAKDLGVPAPMTYSQRDVPGATRASIPLFKALGVNAISVGVNTASMPPSVPRAFVWKDPVSGTQMLAQWHPHGYGGTTRDDAVIIDGFDQAMIPWWRGDNTGPPDRKEVEGIWDLLKLQFPLAKIRASTFDEWFEQLETVQDKLPVVTDDLSDTWIYGVGSDPKKVQTFREIARTFSRCVAEDKCPRDYNLHNFTRLFLKNTEHTWAKDVKTYLHDKTNWTNEQFHAVQHTAPNFLDIVESWTEQRQWGLDFPVEALKSHPLAAYIAESVADLVPPASMDLTGYERLSNTSQPFTVGSTVIGFDATSGAVSTLMDRGSHRIWATAANPVCFFTYKTHDTSDFNTFMEEYAQKIHGKIPSYFPLDFSKPGMGLAGVNRTTATTTLRQLYRKTNGTHTLFLTHLALTDPSLVTIAGAPRDIWVSYALPLASSSEKLLSATVLLFGKTATRIAESLWFSFVPPPAPTGQWGYMRKLGEAVNPLEVIKDGSKHLQAIEDAIWFQDGPSTLTVQALDTPLLSWGSASPFPTPCDAAPDLRKGAHFNLYNNCWGTNYPQWYPFREGDENIKFRFWLSME